MIADRGRTRGRSFQAGLIALAASLTLFLTSRSIFVLIVARVLQGISAAGVWSIGLAIIVDTVRKDRLAMAMGYTSIAMTIGNLLGPMLGGLV